MIEIGPNLSAALTGIAGFALIVLVVWIISRD